MTICMTKSAIIISRPPLTTKSYYLGRVRTTQFCLPLKFGH
jgi:hypothetical protein